MQGCCVFCNSSGGILVYGIEENNHLPHRIDDGITADISREWIEQTIDGNIRPRVAGFIISLIDGPLGRRYVALEIPQATVHAPHQTDYRYYRRSNFKSEPMFDYEVRDAFNRTTSPELFLTFAPSSVELDHGTVTFELQVMIGNKSAQPSLYSSISLHFSSFLDVQAIDADWRNQNQQGLDVSSEFIPMRHFYRRLIVPNHLPVFKEIKWSLGSFKIRMQQPFNYSFSFSIMCPGFPLVKSGAIIYTLGHYPPISIIIIDDPVTNS